MQDRFKFNAVVSSYYDIDTPEEYKEVEPQFYLKNVDVFSTGEIGIDYDTLLETVKEQAKDLTKKEIGQIMQHFEDNSNSPDCEFVTITPNKIIQSTGLKDKNGKLIYEGDIIKYMYYNPKRYTKWVVVFDQNTLEFGLKDYRYGGYLRITRHSILNNKVEVIGNICQNENLLSEANNDR